MKDFKLNLPAICLLCLTVAACSDRDPESNFFETPLVVPVDKPYITQNGTSFQAMAVRIADDRSVSTERLFEENIERFVFANTNVNLSPLEEEDNTDGEADEADEVRIERESSLPEYLIYTEPGKPYDIFAYDYVHDIKTAIFDLLSEEIINPNEKLCSLSPIPRLDIDTFGLDNPYSFTKPGAYFSAALDCDGPWSERNFYELNFEEDEENTRLVDLRISASQTDKVTVPGIIAKRQSAPEALASGNSIVVASQSEQRYGVLGYSVQDQALMFYVPVEASSADVELLWSLPLAAENDAEGNIIFPEFILASFDDNSPVLIRYTNKVYRFNKDIFFDVSNNNERLNSIQTPYFALNDASEELNLLYDSGADIAYYRDGKFIMRIDSSGSVFQELNIIDDHNAIDFQFSPVASGYIINKLLANENRVITLISPLGIESTLQAGSEIRSFSPDAQIYESIDSDSNSFLSRSANSFATGNILTTNFAVFNTAIDRRSSYLGNQPFTTALLESEFETSNVRAEDEQEPSISRPKLSLYDSLGVLSNNPTYLGHIDASVQSIGTVEIFAENFGLVEAVLDSGAKQLYYFNPSEAADIAEAQRNDLDFSTGYIATPL